MTKKILRSLSDPSIVHVPLEEGRASLAADAAYFEKNYGPNVPARLVRPRGRPKKGVVVEAGKVHSVRVPESLWAAAKKKAGRLGVSPNAAVQLALRAWAGRA